MAMTDTARRAAGTASPSLISRLRETYHNWRLRRQTRDELLALTDRELDDIGLSRRDIVEGRFVRHL